MKKINEENLQDLNQLVHHSGLYPNKIVSREKLTTGNMNLTLRCIDTAGHTVIIKQGRDFVEKYPSIPAPLGRTSVEHEYYKKTESDSVLSAMSPDILNISHENQILILEDLGQGNDGISYYENPETLDSQVIEKTTTYLAHLHSIEFDKTGDILKNMEMKKLNALHMFDFPFTEEGRTSLIGQFPELDTLSASIITNKAVKDTAKKLKELYLQTNNTLVHGDFYPGCFFLVENKVYVIDPEFCFWGYPEFDLGVYIGHLHILGKGDSLCDNVINLYTKAKKHVDIDLVNQHAGIEILRRIYGVAQLPLSHVMATTENKKQLTEVALSLL